MSHPQVKKPKQLAEKVTDFKMNNNNNLNKATRFSINNDI